MSDQKTPTTPASTDAPVAVVDRFLDLHRIAYPHNPVTVSGVNDQQKWHRDKAMRFYPLLFTEDDIRENFAAYIKQHILCDMPPFLRLFHFDRPTLTFGSCFASRIRDYLQTRTKDVGNIWVPEGLNNTFALANYFEWVLLGTDSIRNTAFVKDNQGRIVNWAASFERERGVIRDRILRAGGFVFTLGLTEVWRHKETKDVFWRGVPREIFDADVHEAHQSTFAENLANVQRLCALINEFCGPVPIVFTVSPVALIASFRGISAVVADCVSKSILRAVVDEVMEEKRPAIQYWPSFEIVRWLGAHLKLSTFSEASVNANGKVITDSQHIPDWVVHGIVSTFVEAAFVAE